MDDQEFQAELTKRRASYRQEGETYVIENPNGVYRLQAKNREDALRLYDEDRSYDGVPAEFETAHFRVWFTAPPKND